MKKITVPAFKIKPGPMTITVKYEKSLNMSKNLYNSYFASKSPALQNRALLARALFK